MDCLDDCRVHMLELRGGPVGSQAERIRTGGEGAHAALNEPDEG